MFGHLHSKSVYDFVGFFSCLVGSWPKETFVTKGSNFLATGQGREKELKSLSDDKC